MKKPIIKIVDLSKNEEIEREMTDTEFASYTARLEANKIKEQEELASQSARQSALEKLAALGLTEAEIQALAG